MSPEAQRVAIAEACGWRELPIGGIWQSKAGAYAVCNDNPNNFQLPYYLTDLNAMHEAEAVLMGDANKCGGGPIDQYLGHLIQLNGSLFRATAAQRAEAFLRTIGKWSPSPTQGGST